jgi:hypothetical protein
MHAPKPTNVSAANPLRLGSRWLGGRWVCSLSVSFRFGGSNPSWNPRVPSDGAADRSERWLACLVQVSSAGAGQREQRLAAAVYSVVAPKDREG